MKNLLLLFGLLFCQQTIFAQNCANAQSQIDIHGNNIQARILNGGDLFTDFANAQFFPNPDPNSLDNPATIFAAGLWMGGVDPGGNLKLAAVDYRSSNSHDYFPGPLYPDGTTDATHCANWDKHFRITGDEIAAFRAALPLTANELKTQFPSLAAWPGQGNPYFSSVWGYDLPNTGQALAPFFDLDADGNYDPLKGDYPAVQLRGMAAFVPAEIVWCVFNDAGGAHTNSFGKPLQVEVQLTVWAFDCADNPVLNNTLFTSHKIINRATENTDSTFVGIWVDLDLGCSSDDYLGCNPALNTMFGYNQDAVDGQPANICQGTPTFPGDAPVQSITFLNHPLHKFIAPNNSGIGNPPGTSDPIAPFEFYNYLSGSWRDGSPVTYGGNGYGGNTPVGHLYPNDPSDPNGWSMCTASLPLSDRRMIGSTRWGLMEPGRVEELNLAWAFHDNPALPCGLGSTFSDVATLHQHYSEGFSGVCSPLKAPSVLASSVELFPNPTAATAVLRYDMFQPTALRMWDMAGRLVMEQTQLIDKESTTIDASALLPGVYPILVVTEQGTVTKKLVVMR